jgi:hypothetical protein
MRILERKASGSKGPQDASTHPRLRGTEAIRRITNDPTAINVINSIDINGLAGEALVGRSQGHQRPVSRTQNTVIFDKRAAPALAGSFAPTTGWKPAMKSQSSLPLSTPAEDGLET